MGRELSLSEKLCYSTVRLEGFFDSVKSDGSVATMISTGTGFFYILKNKKGESIPVIVTNKHVIKKCTKGRFYINSSDANGDPIDTSSNLVEFDVDFEQMWKLHPDADVDLCAMPIAPILNWFKKCSCDCFIQYLSSGDIPDKVRWNELSAVEDIIMIGYPDGLWDRINNRPIFRKGITATDPKIDYNGKKEFMIDVACFEGSSGSPVVIMRVGTFTDKYGKNPCAGTSLLFLGVLYAGPSTTIQNNVVVLDGKKVVTKNIDTLINLGTIIKAERLNELGDLF